MNKYQHILDKENKEHWDMLTKIFDVSIDYVKANHQEVDIDRKIGAVNVVKKIYLQTDDFSMEQIPNYIDKYFAYVQSYYDSYRGQFEIISDEFHLYISFLNSFIEKKKYLVDTL